MPFADRYRAQVALLVRVLPLIAEQRVFALKGGTAINLFVRDLPRLSVDIDLAYLPVAGRAESLAGIDTAMKALASRIAVTVPGVSVMELASVRRASVWGRCEANRTSRGSTGKRGCSTTYATCAAETVTSQMSQNT